MTLVPKFMYYVPPNPTVIPFAGEMCWPTQRLTTYGGVWANFNPFTQQQINQVTSGLPGPNQSMSTGQLDGLLYQGTYTLARVVGYNPLTGATVKTYNDTGGLLPACGFIAGCSAGGQNIVVSTGLNSGQGAGGGGCAMFAINMDSLTSLGGPIYTQEINTSIAPGNAWVSRGTPGKAWVTAIGNYINGSGPITVGFYEIDLTPSSFTVRRIGGHVAADFGFTSLSGVGTPCQDETDGNLVASVSGVVSGSTVAVLCKFASSDAHIMWQVNAAQQFWLHESRIATGSLYLIENANFNTTVNTSNGVKSNEALTTPIGTANWIYSNDLVRMNLVNVNNNPGANPAWAVLGGVLPPPRVIARSLISGVHTP